MHVIHLTKGTIVENKGGPVMVIQLIMKVKEQVNPLGVEMSAVFGNKVASSYKRDIFPIIAKYDKRGGNSLLENFLNRVFPKTVRFCAELGVAGLRFFYHFGKGTKSNSRNELVLHSHDPFSGYLCCLSYAGKRPLIHTIHGKGGSVKEPLYEHPVFQGTIVEKIWRHIEITIAKRVDIMVFTSKGSLELYNNEYPGLLQNKDVRIVYLGIDMAELERGVFNQNLLSKYGVKEGKSVVLCVAKLVIEKGIDTLIEAVALLPSDIRQNLSCLIVGEGFLRHKLQALVDQNGLQDTIKILGFLPRSELMDLFKSSTVFVLPNRVAVFDYALLEAAAMKLPIVTTGVGGNLEMFGDNSALFVPPDNPKVLSEAISQMLTSIELRRDVAQKAYDRVKNTFSLDAMLKNYLAIYEELVTLHHKGSNK
jgi:glycosyltransferase involved in cell wall biosynthesis